MGGHHRGAARIDIVIIWGSLGIVELNNFQNNKNKIFRSRIIERAFESFEIDIRHIGDRKKTQHSRWWSFFIYQYLSIVVNRDHFRCVAVGLRVDVFWCTEVCSSCALCVELLNDECHTFYG